MISIILTVHNKESLIEKVYQSILDNMSDTKQIIVVFDGCTDRSEQIIKRISRPDISIYANDEHEVISNNLGLKSAFYDYCLLIQDDMIIREPFFDRRLLQPFFKFQNVFAVTGRDTTNDRLENSHVVFTDKTIYDRNLFQIRDVAIRGPLMFKKSYLKQLNFLDESFAPVTFDDHDLCIRAKKQLDLISGSYVIDVESRPEWGTTRQKNQEQWQIYYDKNEKLLIERHKDFLLSEKIIEARLI